MNPLTWRVAVAYQYPTVVIWVQVFQTHQNLEKRIIMSSLFFEIICHVWNLKTITKIRFRDTNDHFAFWLLFGQIWWKTKKLCILLWSFACLLPCMNEVILTSLFYVTQSTFSTTKCICKYTTCNLQIENRSISYDWRHGINGWYRWK